MGNMNSIYRITPRRTLNSTIGHSSNLQFAASQITGWRSSQEDRYVCLPYFYKDFSLFGVYDGHGGEEVVQYLERFLHKFIVSELELTNDAELALYLSFMTCDNSLRNISDAERALIENDLVKEFEVPDQVERRKILFGPSTSGENNLQDDLRAAIASACMKELPSVSYLTQAPVEESDEDDSDYNPGDKVHNIFSGEMDSDSSSSESSESMDLHQEGQTIEKEDTGKQVKGNREEQECNEEKDFDKQIAMHCGSTATVLLINETKIYIAHVGDSRVVGCVKGEAIDLSTDHRPQDKAEYDRIIKAGGTVSEDGRIDQNIDMSRAFGDFCYKATDDDPFQILSVEPSISTFEISPDLEFIIVASDGIWNTMNSSDVIKYIRRRISEPNLELRDLIGELFEELLPEKITDDGSGCDNMTAIIIKFTSSQGPISKNCVCYREVSEFKYPPINDESCNSSTNFKASSTAENSKDCKESSQLNLDEKNFNNQISIKSKNDEKI